MVRCALVHFLSRLCFIPCISMARGFCYMGDCRYSYTRFAAWDHWAKLCAPFFLHSPFFGEIFFSHLHVPSPSWPIAIIVDCFTKSVQPTDIHQRTLTSYTTLCNGVVSHGAQFGGLCRPHTQKYTQNKCVSDLCTPCGILRLFVIMLRSGYIRTWRTTVTRKTWRPPNSAPSWDQDGVGSGIWWSLVYICDAASPNWTSFFPSP